MMKCVVGVDLGGTNVRAQALFEDGSPAGERFENESMAQKGTETILEQLALTIRQAVGHAEGEVRAVGLAIPGHIDDAAGSVRWAPNFGEYVDGVFHYWQNVSIKPTLARLTGLPIVMANDANAAALGEYMFGVGRNSANCLVMVTLGTGIGGGVVLSPKSVFGVASSPLLLLGGNLGGAELGHTIVQKDGLDCTAGTYGTVEAYCQRDAIIRRTTHRLRRGRASLILDLVAGDLAKVTPYEISLAAEQGDALALQVWREFGEVLGTGLASMINVFAPDILAIGGQISKAGEFFLPALRTAVEDNAVPSLAADCWITLAEQVEDAGILGGAALALASV